MVNTKRASLLKTAIASGASCWREPFFLKNSRGNKAISPNQSTDRGGRAPFFFNLKKRASERAERGGGWARRSRAGERASLRAVREQTSVDVSPVVRGQWRNFTDVGEQAEDR
jgi:hypothetical protein